MEKIKRARDRERRMESDDSSDSSKADDEPEDNSDEESPNDGADGIAVGVTENDEDDEVEITMNTGCRQKFERDSLQSLKASTKAVNAMRKTAHSLEKSLKRKRAEDASSSTRAGRTLRIEEDFDNGKEAHPNPLAFVIGESSNVDRDSEGATAQQILRRADVARFCEGINKQTFPLRRIVKQNALVKFALSDMEKTLLQTGFNEDTNTLAGLLGITEEVYLARLEKIRTIFNDGINQIGPIRASLIHEQQLAIAINRKTTSTSVTDYIKRFEGNSVFSDKAAKRAAEIEKLERREEQERLKEKKHTDNRWPKGRGRGRDYFGGDGRDRFPHQAMGFNPNMNAGINPGPFNFGVPANRFANSGYTSPGFGGFGGNFGSNFVGGGRGHAKICHKCHSPYTSGHQCPQLSKP